MEGPSKTLLGLEGLRAIYEYGLSWLLIQPLRMISPAGDGHPVVIIPGLGTADGSTQFMRSFLKDIGYTSYTWGLGRNLGPREGLDALLLKIIEHIEQISLAHNNEPVSVVGWSLGGIYSREIAKLRPDLIRQVITLGSPFKGDSDSTNATFLYELLSKDKSHRNPQFLKRISEPPSVPFTSIYSKTDGVVYWKSSIEDEGICRENIEIPGASHLGLAHNPLTMYVIADRLRYSKETWVPFKK